jgi:hypothetical protein
MWTDPGIRNELVDAEVGSLLRNDARAEPGPGRRDALDDFGDAYAEASRLDFLAICRQLFAVSRPDRRRSGDTEYDVVVSDAAELDAYAALGAADTSRILVSLGLFWALDDVVTRLVCLTGFAATDPEQIVPLEAAAVDSESFVVNNDLEISPRARFYDYAATFRQDTGRGTALSRFYTVIPLNSERKALAQLLLRLGLLWVILHEESHHILGHVRYFREAQGMTAQEYALHEVAEHEMPAGANLSKVAEWQADRSATRGVMDVVMRPSVVNELPGSFASPPWLLRLALVAIGCVITLFDRARLIARAQGAGADPGSHPSERTRLLAAAIHARGQNDRHAAIDGNIWVGPLDTDSALFNAARDLAVANRPGAREMWPLAWDWEPPTGSTMAVWGVLHIPDWNQVRVDPFADVMLHDEVDAYLGCMLLGMDWTPNPFGKAAEEDLLRGMYGNIRSIFPDLSYETFVRRYASWVREMAAIVDAHDEWVWDLLSGYRDDRWA